MFRSAGYNGRVSMNPLYPSYKTLSSLLYQWERLFLAAWCGERVFAGCRKNINAPQGLNTIQTQIAYASGASEKLLKFLN